MPQSSAMSLMVILVSGFFSSRFFNDCSRARFVTCDTIFEAVQDNKPFILNVYRCVHREQVEKYLQPLVDRLLLDVINEEIGEMNIREEDKQFIARVYSYILIGLMLDWIKDDMREDPQQIVDRLAKLIKGSVSAALSRFQL